MCTDKGIESEMIGCIKAVDIMNRRSIQVEIRLLITEAVFYLPRTIIQSQVIISAQLCSIPMLAVNRKTKTT